jgi:hypothetical protein
MSQVTKYAIIGGCAFLIFGTVIWPMLRTSRRRKAAAAAASRVATRAKSHPAAGAPPGPIAATPALSREVATAELASVGAVAIESDPSPSMGVAPVAHEAVIEATSDESSFWSSTGSEVSTHVATAQPSGVGPRAMPSPAPAGAVRRAVEQAASSKGRMTTGGAATGSVHALAGAEPAGQVATQPVVTAPAEPGAVVAGVATGEMAAGISAPPLAHPSPVVPAAPEPVAPAAVPASPISQLASEVLVPAPVAASPVAPAAEPRVDAVSSGPSWPTTIEHVAPVAPTPIVAPAPASPVPAAVAAVSAPMVAASSFPEDRVVERVDRDLTDAEIAPFTPSWPSVATSNGASRPPERVVVSEDGEEPTGWLVTSKIADALRIAQEQGGVEEYLDGRGDVIRLHLRLDEDEFRRLTANPGVEQFEAWDGEPVPQN